MGKLLAVYLFGSAARGDSDEQSDLDVLAVVEDGHGKVEASEVERLIPFPSTREISLSWYGHARLRQMFQTGELFAWHLHQEGQPVWEAIPLLSSLGNPAPYCDWDEDIMSFRRILRGIPAQIDRAPENCVYEFGLIYICARNVAMAASWCLCDHPDFARYSPYRLGSAPLFPMSIDQYDKAMRCRLAGQRGFVPPEISPQEVITTQEAVDDWIGKLLGVLRGIDR